MKLKIVVLLCFVFALRFISFSQKIEVRAKQQSLNHVLIDLRDRYHMQFSFNDELLAKYIINTSKSFSKEEDAIRFLLKNTALAYQYSNDVFLIFPSEKKKQYHLIGKLYDVESKESLPFSHLTINNIPLVSDFSGGFSFTTEKDSSFRLLASHLGYFVLDTILNANQIHQLYLYPAQTDLPEIVVSDKMVQNFIKVGNEAGNLKLNHKIVNFLPGNGDNSVFELLRMQPGIAASSEQSDRVIIWGSYDGETQVLFDGITLWGLKNTYQDIGDINPLMAKHIDVEKGGYDARYDGKVGGFVNITGKNGNRNKAALNLWLSNVTANASFEMPLSKKSSLIAAYRRTYYNLYESELVRTVAVNSNGNALLEDNIILTPAYQFHDMNLKYSYSGDNGDAFYVSLLHGANEYAYGFTEGRHNQVQKNKNENTKQFGASVFYNKQWKKGGRSEFFVASSGLNSEINSLVQIDRIRKHETEVRRNDVQKNKILEYKVGLRHDINLSEKILLQTGFTYLHNKIEFSEDSHGVSLMDFDSDLNRLTAFLQNKIAVNENLTAKIGINLNYPTHINQLYFDPRFSLSYKISKSVSVNSAWGLYRQFMSRSIILDVDGNYDDFWIGSDDKTIPVLEAQHTVFGASYHDNDFTLSLEAYHKFTNGHTRYFRNRKIAGIAVGKSQTYGLDFYLKKSIGKQAFWLAYTLGRTEEKFEYGQVRSFQRALQDQTHEIKFAGLVNIGNVYCSANYIWGSGFPLYNQLQNEILSEPNYSRLDASIIYKLKPRKIKAEFGVMFLNIFDRENTNYFNSELVNIGQNRFINVSDETMPFSVRLFLKIGF